jgi:D-2-hydroxyacid dehydrogenase (NADP+)
MYTPWVPTMLSKILVYLTHPEVEAWNFKSRHFDYLQKTFPKSEIIHCPNSKAFLDQLPEADAVIVWFFKSSWLELSKNLKLIATPAAGKDWIDVAPTDSLEISFGSFHGVMIAESVVGAALHFCKAFTFSSKMQKQHKWGRVKLASKISSLIGAHVVILGFGNIGIEIGRKLKPFGCSITGIRRSSIKNPDYFDDKDKLLHPDLMEPDLKKADHLIFALPGGPETTEFFSETHFNVLSKRCFLYNIGRGNVYKESDLVKALSSNKIAGAYLDVFEKEPLVENSLLWDMENVLIQPHLSAASPQYLDFFIEELAIKLNKKSYTP